jgi:hypothetical protein
VQACGRKKLTGSAGEQDLELYCTLAGEYPDQIRAIFIRDGPRRPVQLAMLLLTRARTVTTPLVEALEAKAPPKPAASSRSPHSFRAPSRSQTDPSAFAEDGLRALSLEGLEDRDTDALSPNNPLSPTADSGVSEARRKLVEVRFDLLSAGRGRLTRAHRRSTTGSPSPSVSYLTASSCASSRMATNVVRRPSARRDRAC